MVAILWIRLGDTVVNLCTSEAEEVEDKLIKFVSKLKSIGIEQVVCMQVLHRQHMRRFTKHTGSLTKEDYDKRVDALNNRLKVSNSWIYRLHRGFSKPVREVYDPDGVSRIPPNRGRTI